MKKVDFLSFFLSKNFSRVYFFYVEIISLRDDFSFDFIYYFLKSSLPKTISHLLNVFEIVYLRDDFSYKK